MYDQHLDRLLAWIRQHTPSDRGVLIPISGGSDSALCFWAYNQVCPERTVGVYIGDQLRCREWFEQVGTVRLVEPLPHVVPDHELLRWTQVLHLALAEKRILVGTRNRTEHELGTFSHASRVAFHLPLVQLWKSEILKLDEQIGVPEEILRSSREADVVCGREEAYARIAPEYVDAFLHEQLGEGRSGLEGEQRAYLETLYMKSRYKRDLPLI